MRNVTLELWGSSCTDIYVVNNVSYPGVWMGKVSATLQARQCSSVLGAIQVSFAETSSQPRGVFHVPPLAYDVAITDLDSSVANKADANQLAAYLTVSCTWHDDERCLLQPPPCTAQRRAGGAMPAACSRTRLACATNTAPGAV